MADYWDKLQQTWPARAAQGLWEGLLAPGRALQSTEPMTSEQMIAPAFDMAGLMMGGGIAGTGEGAGAALGSGAARMRMVDNVDLFKEMANQRRAAGMSVGKSAEGWDFKRPQAEKGSWEDLFARTKSKWEGDKARAISQYEQAAPGAVPRSPYMSDADYAEVAKPTFTLGSGATDKKTAGLVQGIRAYHGSPHDFDAFDLSKIGTGEGAQAYGHGLYFAEHEPTARWYRDTLGPMVNPQPAEHQVATDALQRFGGREQALAALDDVIKTREAGMYKPTGQYFPYHDEASLARDLLKNPEWQPKPPGKMYEVNINAEPEHFLDWDKPLSQQSPKVQETLKNAMGPNWDQFKSADAGTAVKNGLIAPSAEGTAANLSGIPGIKYLDQGSRGAGQGSSNYVVFNDKLIDILKKYAIAGTLGAPFFGNNSGDQQQ